MLSLKAQDAFLYRRNWPSAKYLCALKRFSFCLEQQVLSSEKTDTDVTIGAGICSPRSRGI
jgi:hypothetical protein